MILKLFSGLLLLSLLSVVIIQGQHRRVWSIILLLAGSWLMYDLFAAFSNRETSRFIYQWLSYQGLQASLNLSSFPQMEKLLLPFMGTSLFLIYMNSIYRPETHRLGINSVILLNLAAFILLASASDFIQLLVGSCFFTVLGYYLVTDMKAKTLFIFYNFLADMSLFTALAVVYSYSGSISLDNFADYQKSGWHHDLVAVLILFSLLVKAGLFPFQNQMQALAEINFNRLITLSFSSAPIAALLLFRHLNPLLSPSHLSGQLFLTALIISLLWGTWGALINDNLKSKCLYLNQMFYSFILATLYLNPTTSLTDVTLLFPIVLALNFLLLMIYISSSHENYVSRMGGFFKNTKLTFILSLGGVVLFCSMLNNLNPSPAVRPLYWLYLSCSLLALSHLFYMVYFGKSRADDRVSALLRNAEILYWAPLLILEAAAFWIMRQNIKPELWWLSGAFLVLSVSDPLRFLNRWSDNETLQDSDPIGCLFRVFILTPLRLLGRILWIAVDFVLIERSIIGGISQTTRFMVNGLQRIQSALWLNYLMMMLLGLSIIAFAIGYRYYD